MYLTRMQPAFPLGNLHEEMDRLFGGLWTGWPREQSTAFPALTVWEDHENYYAEAELPGRKMEELEVVVTGNELTIKGARQAPEAKEGVTWHRRERGTGVFARVVRLPAEIESQSAQAILKDGILTLTLPKAREARARKIEVKTSA